MFLNMFVHINKKHVLHARSIKNAFMINIVSCLSLLYFSKIKLEHKPELKQQYIVIAFFFLFVGLMQLYDYIFWTNSANSGINQATTKIAMITNHLQPIVLMLLIMFVMKKKLNTITKSILGLYAVTAIIYSISNWGNLQGTQKTAESGDSLDWTWNHFTHSGILYALFLLSLVILIYTNFSDKGLRIISILLVLITFFFSVWKYQIKLSAGRFWCYFASLVPIIYLIKVFVD